MCHRSALVRSPHTGQMLGRAHGSTRVLHIIAEGGREPLQAQQHLPWYSLPVPLVMRSRREGDMGARTEIPQSWLNPHLAQLGDIRLPSGKGAVHTPSHTQLLCLLSPNKVHQVQSFLGPARWKGENPKKSLHLGNGKITTCPT